MYINPPSVFPDGQKRLIFIDFLRGLAIFLMLHAHEWQSMVDNDEMNRKGVHQVFYFILGVPTACIAGFRTFFILISGISHAYIFGSTVFGKSPLQILLS